MAKSTGARSELAYVVESVYGTTPAIPSLTVIPRTGGVPTMIKESFQSADIRADRQVADMRHGFRSSALSLAVELRHTDYDDLFESLFYSTFSTNVLKIGNTQKSLSIEAAYNDITQFALMTGAIVNSFSCSITPDGMATATFEVVGQDLAYGVTSVDADGYTAASGNEPFDSLTGSINEGGSASSVITGINFTITNNIEPAKIIGSATAPEQIEGLVQVSGTVTAYFEDVALVNKFINETSSSLDVTLQDPAGKTLKFDFGNILYTDGNPDVGGTGPAILSLPFTALYDGTDLSTAVLTRSA